MLTFWRSTRQRWCDGISRRAFLTIGALGMGGLTWADLLRCQARGGEKTPPRPKSVIMLYLWGGPSHLDLYDLKPNAPVEYRGEFAPIRTKVPGMDICELMPLQAKIADKLAIIRNLRFQTASRGPIADDHCPPELFSGFPREANRPALGSVVARMRTDAGVRGEVPAFVLLSHATGAPGSFSADAFPAYLGSAHQPFTPGQLKDLSLSRELSLERLGERASLLKTFDRINRDIDDRRGSLAGADAFSRQALEMIVAGRVRDALDLSKEPAKVQQSYGQMTDLLVARRLVEAGVPVVNLVPRGLGWDHHGDIFKGMRTYLPMLDRGISTLVTDLHERGLDQDVAVVVWGEMGRTPRVNASRGRDHWPQAGFALVAGGGLTMGQVIGATTAKGEAPAGKHYTPQNVLATLYQMLGIRDIAGITFADHSGRPVHLLDDPTTISELV
jgi:hypothetical protein